MEEKTEQKNLLDFVPEHAINYEMSKDNRIILLKPKFKNRFCLKYIQPRLKSPHYKISLDEFGSWVWQKIDAKTTVYDIGLQLQHEFGDRVQPVFDRLGLFINQLARYGFIRLSEDNNSST